MRWFICGMLLVVLASVVVVIAADAKIQKPLPGVPWNINPTAWNVLEVKDFAEHLRTAKTAHKPTNGVLFSVTGLEEVSEQGFRYLRIRYEIAYSAARSPLTISLPSLLAQHAQPTTTVEIIAEGKNGKSRLFPLAGPKREDWPSVMVPPASRDFATQKDGKPISGFLDLPLDIDTPLGPHEADFASAYLTAQRKAVRLRFKADDRGLKQNLDAWTGELDSNFHEQK